MIVYVTRDGDYPDYVEEEISSYWELFKFRDCQYLTFDKGIWNAKWKSDGSIYFPHYGLKIIDGKLNIISNTMSLRVGFEFSLDSCLGVYFLFNSNDTKRYCLKELIMGVCIRHEFIDYMFGLFCSSIRMNSDSKEYGMVIDYLSRNDL